MELVAPLMLKYVIDQGIRAGDMQAVWRGSGIMLGAALVGAVATVGQGFCRAWLSQGLAFDLRNALFTHIQSFSFGNLDAMQTGQIMTRVSSDVDVVRGVTGHGLSLLLRATLMIVGSMVMLLIIDWQLALVVLALLPIAAVLMTWLVRVAQPMFLVVQQKLAALNTLVQENLAGVQVVKAFAREPHEIEQFGGSNVAYMAQQIKVGRLLAIANPALTFLTTLGIVAVTWWRGVAVIGGRLSVGELVAFTSYLMIGMTPLMMLSNILTMITRAEASAERVLEVLDTQSLLPISASPHRAQMAGRVAFENVSFRYDGDGGGENVLVGISFAVGVGSGWLQAASSAAPSSRNTSVRIRFRFIIGLRGWGTGGW